MSCNVDRVTIIGSANNKNRYSNSVSCDSENLTAASSPDFLRWCAKVFSALPSSRVARSRFQTSILP